MKKLECNGGFEFERLEELDRRMVSMIKQLTECREKGCDSEVSLELLSDIQKTIYDRFKVEEMYMRRNNDPDLPTHREQHRLFMKSMTYCWLEIMEEHRQVSVEFCNYLVEWLDFHTQNLDSKLRSHLEKKGVV